jgi:hypothetical protein
MLRVGSTRTEYCQVCERRTTQECTHLSKNGCGEHVASVWHCIEGDHRWGQHRVVPLKSWRISGMQADDPIPSFDELIDVLRVRIRDADAINSSELHSFKELRNFGRDSVRPLTG